MADLAHAAENDTSFDEMMAIHGHPEYGTEIVWIDYE